MTRTECGQERSGSFDPNYFQALKHAEKDHFWFKVRRKWIFDTLKKYLPPPAKVLEVGCGTGNVSSYLAQKGYTVTGCEYYSEAIRMAWPGFEIVKADAASLPFAANSFDIVCLFDVIEHLHNDAAVLKEAGRVLKKTGIIALSVPAREELWSGLDEAALHKRRYTKTSLAGVLQASGLVPRTMDYMFMSLYLPAKYLRQKASWGSNDYFSIDPFLNRFLGWLFDVERTVSKVFRLPVGTSLIAVAKR